MLIFIYYANKSTPTIITIRIVAVIYTSYVFYILDLFMCVQVLIIEIMQYIQSLLL